jgi:hypothetical protein
MSSIENISPSDKVQVFFDTYFDKKIEISANKVDATVGFFKDRGFDEQAALSISAILLEQSIKDKVDIFKVLDTLKVFNKVQLSGIVAKILNTNRSAVSLLGIKSEIETTTIEARNVVY